MRFPASTPPPLDALQHLIDPLKGNRRFGIQKHPERRGWVRLTGRRDLAGVEVDTTARLLASCDDFWRRGICEALLEAEQELRALR